MSRQPRASGYFRTDYAQDLALTGTRLERVALTLFVIALIAFPLVASPFQLDLACQEAVVEVEGAKVGAGRKKVVRHGVAAEGDGLQSWKYDARVAEEGRDRCVGANVEGLEQR